LIARRRQEHIKIKIVSQNTQEFLEVRVNTQLLKTSTVNAQDCTALPLLVPT